MFLLLNDFDGVLKEMEVFLCIDSLDYANRDINSAISNIRSKIQRQYAVDVSSLDENHLNDSPTLLDGMVYFYSQLASFSHTFRFKSDVPINLGSVNYFGMTKTSFLSTLKLLQRDDRVKQISDVMEKVKEYIKTVPMCLEKKLLMLLYISYMLKFYQVTSVIAEILYLGGVNAN